MCTALEKLKNEGRQEGRQEGRREGRREGRQEGRREGRQEGRREGRQEGRREGLIESAGKLLQKGFSVSEAARLLELPETEVSKIQKSACK